jgi:oligopeptide/dipeptide ABC transporter ATP-binding protein
MSTWIGINYGMILIETIIEAIVLILIFNTVNKSFPKEKRLQKAGNVKSLMLSSLIAFGIILVIRYIFGFLWFFDYGHWHVTTFFAIMAIIFYPLYRYLLRRFGIKDLSKNYKIIFNSLIGIFWLIALIFLSIYLFRIEMASDPLYDEFLLGFEFAFFVIIIDLVFTNLVHRIIPIEKRIPNDVLKKTKIISSVAAFGIWSIQLVIVELYLGRLFGIYLSIGGILIGMGIFFIICVVGIFIKAPDLLLIDTVLTIVFLTIGATLSIILGIFHLDNIYIQDIRVLILAVTGIYIILFFILLKRKFLPEMSSNSRQKLQIVMQKMHDKKIEISKVNRDKVVLKIQDLTTYFYTEEGVVKAVEGVSFEIFEGEVLGLVGETGCGKSVTALSILQLVPPPGKIEEGKVLFNNENLLEKTETEMVKNRGKDITMIFQDPLNSLNPVYKVGKQISEVFLLHMEDELLVESSKYQDKSTYSIAQEWTVNLLKDLNIPAPEMIFDRYPHELSGGMRQRVQIAMALACSPKLLIADEPTTALDVTIQNQILKLMKDLKKKYNTSILFITHDLGIISKMCDRVTVMYSGFIVEYGVNKEIFQNPKHPYTHSLIVSVPIIGKKREELEVIPGIVPNLIYPPSGCRFHPRCEYRFNPCDSKIPRRIEIKENHFVACHLYDKHYKNQAQISIKGAEAKQT